MTDLSSFNITHFAAGSANVRVATLPPISAPAPSPSPSPDDNDDGFSLLSSDNDINSTSSDPTDSSRTALQLLYPADSINPAARPLGGAEFYAAPLDLSNASSVTLTYSVFFPSTFDWVLGGKLPGLYGGRDGCSGGDPAEDCFSTRLMWRKGGVGELYLYAPKDKQPAALCADPHSICDAAYGLSIGRGAFRFPAGQWTTVSQTVALNTPGKADGGFALDVNGVRVVQRSDVYYRGTGIRAASVPDLSATTLTSKKPKATSSKHPKPTSTKHKPTSTAAPVDDPDDGGLLGILGQQEGDGEAPVGFVSESAVDPVSAGTYATGASGTSTNDTYGAQNFLGGADDDGEGDSLPWGTDDDDLLASLGTNVAIPISTTAVPSPSETYSPGEPSGTNSPGESSTYSPGEQGQETGAAAGALMGTAGAQVPWGVSASGTSLITASGTSLITAAPSATPTSVDPAAPTTTTDDGLGFLGLQAGAQNGEDGEDDEGQASPHLARFRGLFFSTFFGGHEEEWATPVDQYVLFRDFAISKNA
ncbi:hypothetical protein K523DRAFT_286460 [Schizophyllum commune Tattone D]|nr:hypothetical protein K523DRAFT_286460 [Schizophyllum commune Tattone D]